MNLHLISCCLEEGNLSYPLGALCIQSAVNSHFTDASLCCTHTSFTLEDDPQQAARMIAPHNPSCIGLSVYLWNRAWMDRFAREMKEQDPSLVIFAGGPEATANPTSFAWDVYDFLILGEGEVSTVQAIEQLLAGTPPEGLGIVKRDDLPTYSPAPDLARLDSVLLSSIADAYVTEGSSVLWEMTRGCPFHCSFCFESRGQRSVRHVPLARLEAELDYLILRKVSEVYILDPTFNMDKQRTLRLLSLLGGKAQHIHFVFEVRAELLDAQLADAFAKLDCSLQIGLQSSDAEVLAQANRRFDAKQFARNIELLNERGLPFGLDLIIGLPLDSLDRFKRSLDYAMLLKPSNLDIFILSLLPGTLVADQASSFGLVAQEQAPYSLLNSPTFPSQDLATALRLKKACDLFFTVGQAGMWLGKFCEATALRPSTLLTLFESYLASYCRKTGKQEEELDIFAVQEAFVLSMLRKTGAQQYQNALVSYMELHQGIAFFHTYGASPVLELSYSLDQLSYLEHMSLDQFLARNPVGEAQRLGIYRSDEGELMFIPLHEEN
ncbi:MAG: radical SAM protein [Sphaerochaeta sp.]|uniref:B12-binding domain-containing radical SAM protein n=1 Tax=Sphaerochaeta sp. TaxID=1972642 RepID=UPI002FC79CB3